MQHPVRMQHCWVTLQQPARKSGCRARRPARQDVKLGQAARREPRQDIAGKNASSHTCSPVAIGRDAFEGVNGKVQRVLQGGVAAGVQRLAQLRDVRLLRQMQETGQRV